jgi:hypothetical protein
LLAAKKSEKVQNLVSWEFEEENYYWKYANWLQAVVNEKLIDWTNYDKLNIC